MTDSTGLPRPVVSPDGTRYWDGSEWRLLPGPNSEWDGTQWLAKPEGVESRWSGKIWAVRPTPEAEWSGTEWLPPPDGVEARWDGQSWRVREDPESMWNGTQWVPPPSGVRAAWNGKSWVRAPSETATWSGSSWGEPSTESAAGPGSRSRRKLMVAVVLAAVLLVGGAVVTVFLGGAGGGASTPSPQQSSGAPLTEAEVELMTLMDADGESKFTRLGVSQRDQVDAIQSVCEFAASPEVEGGTFGFEKRILRKWAGRYGITLSDTFARDGSQDWLSKGMFHWCPEQRYRYMIISSSGVPSSVDEVDATAEGKGRVKVSWTDLRAEYGQYADDIEGGISYQYRVAGGVWTRTSDPSALIEGLVPGEVVEVEVRVAYGDPDLGGPVGLAVADKVLVK